MHQTKCLDCGVANGAAQAHNFIYQIINGNYHRASCSVCLYAQMAAHSFTNGYTYVDSNNHTCDCACGYGTSESHTTSKLYSYSGSHHMKNCIKCGGEVIREPHIIKNGKCTVCGCTAFSIGSIENPETVEADIGETISEESAVTDD